MGPLRIQKGKDSKDRPGAWVHFVAGQNPVFVAHTHWVGFDFDGTISRNDNEGHFEPPYPLGEPIPDMIATIKSLLNAQITVKIFTARACEPENIPLIQEWTERNGLGRLEVTSQKDYHMIRFFDDRAIPVVENSARHQVQMKLVEKEPIRDAGSRMHLLDWLESVDFLPALREMVKPTRFKIDADAVYQPKGRHNPRESLLKAPDKFLSVENQTLITAWWLVHQKGAALPTWDLVVNAVDPDNRPALILIEAKAHASELSVAGKEPARRNNLAQQTRSNDNHKRIGEAIEQAAKALREVSSQINLSRDESYQFANRIAFSWKLASLGIPVALIYLGFTGDKTISDNPEDEILHTDAWKDVFRKHTIRQFPSELWDREIKCGLASFWLLVRGRQVLQQSPGIELRRKSKQALSVAWR